MSKSVLTPLLPFQEQGVRLMKEFNFRALLADEQGLGKTLQALTCAVRYNLWPCVVICPSTLKLHWQNQAMEHRGLKSTILHGTKPRTLASAEPLVIINYDILRPWLPRLERLHPKLVIVDEVHYIGTLISKRTRAVMKLCKGVPHLIFMSGTPLTNRPWELFPTLHALCPQEFPSAHAYGSAYCDAEFSFGRWRFRGARNLKGLHNRLKLTCMVRRKKADVLQDLPPKTRTVLPLDIEDRAQYERAEKDLISWLMETNPLAARRARNAEEYAKWTHLKRLACRLKMKRVVEWVKGYLEESDGKILLGVWHTDTTQRLLHSFGNCSTVIDGSKTQRQRQEAESRFKKDPGCRILIGNYKSAGVGLNLPEADTVGLVEIPWNPATCVQFEDRAHRMNSVNPVSVVYFVAHGTIEERLCQINDRKMRITDTVLDGVKSQDSSLTIYEELLDALVKVKRGKDAGTR